VGLAFGARFGPDIDDVATWQKMAIDIVDGQETSGTEECALICN
jgi:hypothetical protein